MKFESQSASPEIELEQLLAAAALFTRNNSAPAPLESSENFVPALVGEEAPMANDSIAGAAVIYRIEFERKYDQNIGRVWSAVSNESELTEWMKYPVTLDPRVGGAIRVDFAPDDPLEGIICSFDPPRQLAFSWGDSLVKWELEADANSTKVRFSHIGVRPELVVGLGAGWHAFLDQLEDYLTGSASRPDRYVDLTERYHAALRPLLSRR